jgi:hypothetical protein
MYHDEQLSILTTLSHHQTEFLCYVSNMRAFLFVSALFAALAIAAPNPVPEAEPEMGVMPRACPGPGARCGDGQHWVCILHYPTVVLGEGKALTTGCSARRRRGAGNAVSPVKRPDKLMWRWMVMRRRTGRSERTLSIP